MIFKNWVFWLIVTCIFILCFLIGCDDFESPNVRYVSTIKVYSIGGPEYDGIVLNGDVPKRCNVDSAAQFCYADGTPVSIGGLRFEVVHTGAEYYSPASSGGGGYWWPTNEGGVVSTLVTDDSGYCEFSAWCTLWGVRQTNVGMSAKGKRTEPTGVASGGFINGKDPRTGYQSLIPWESYVYVNGWWIIGGHYQCGGPRFSNNIPREDIRPPRPSSITSMVSAQDSEFLTNNSTPIENGFVIASNQWCQRSGQPGNGYAKEVTRMAMLDHSHPGTLQYRSTPYFLTLQITVAEPLNESFVGLSIPCKLYNGTEFVNKIGSSIVKISDDGLRLILQSDYLIPIDARDFNEQTIPSTVYDRWTFGIDPNTFYAPLYLDDGDPNTPAIDPNLIDENGVFFTQLASERYVPVYCVPIADGESLRIEHDRDEILIALFPSIAENWLTDDKNCDMNNDGIVNLKDLSNL